MFESLLAVPLHFTVEFLGFLIAAGAAILAVSRPALVPGPPSNRYSVALGFLALAVAHVIHGGAFDPEATDGSQVVVAAKSLGFALILIGVVGTLRPTGAAMAIAGYSVEKPLLFAPAGAALLVGIACLSSAKREGAVHYRRLAVAMGLFAVAEILTAGAPDAIFGAGSVDRFAYLGHIFRTAAWMSVAGWFWSEIAASIRVRFVASFSALLVAVVLALSTTLTGVISSNVQDEELDRVRSQASNATESIDDRIGGELSRVVRAIAGFEDVQDALAADANPQSLAEALADRRLFDVDFIVIDTPKALPGFVGQGPVKGLSGRDLVEPPLTRGQRVGIIGSDVYTVVSSRRNDISANATRVVDRNRQYVAVIAATNVYRGPKLVGTIALGQWIDTLYMSGVESQLSAEASLIAGNKVVASTLPKRFSRELDVPSSVNEELQLEDSAADQVQLDDRTYFSGFSLLESNGRQVGVFVVSSEARVVAGARSSINRLLFLAAMLVGAIALVLAWLSGRRITRPIQALTETAASVREGNLSAQAQISGNDEVGQLGETFNEMTASLLKMTSDLREAAREEHALRSRIETIIQSMADGLVAVDADRKVLAFNREAEHLTGMSADDAIGRPVVEVLSVTDAQGEEMALPIDSLSEGSLGGVMLRRAVGDPVPVAITTSVLRNEDGEIAGGVTVMRDMSREREIERMKTEFLSNISHELRTPLTPIKGYSEIIQRKEVPREKLLQFVGGILESTSRLERIVELLVDFAAMEAGRMAPRSAHVDIRVILDELAERWRKRSPSHELLVDIEGDLPDALGDERLLRRSLDEVLDNAIKFSPDGGRIRLEAREVHGNGNGNPDMVEVTIVDEGIGIQPEDLPRIFSDFQQLDGSETRAYGGLGLGLAYVRRIALAHDGDVRVESEPERGTRLTLVIPAAEQAV